MVIRSVGLGLYMMFVYWLSSHSPGMHMLFFPTLGAFGFLFITRSPRMKELFGIAGGAVLSAAVGTAAYALHGGMVSLFCSTLAMIWLVRALKLNAPPIIAVALIPFFAHPDKLWVAPASVAVSIAGLLAVMGLVYAVEGLFARVQASLPLRQGVQMDADN
ncbi:HPP family protein [Paenibacillus sp. MWE-103]|uniref:HPP family protein n=1 Tax=Paenibacillus artemisiicola TaxID=1172618 RepID=A0ABS3W8M9_9BACL|nr:HPP family protein [Paenibacillus artemisiicola]